MTIEVERRSTLVATTPSRQLGAPRPESRRQAQGLLRRMGHSFSGLTGVVLMTAVVLGALTAPLVAPAGYQQQDLGNRLRPPLSSTTHLLGTDPLGRDVWSRLVWAARVSLGIAAVSVLLSMSLGVGVGLLTGYYGGALDMVLMRVVDVQLAFPYLLLAIAVVALLGPSLTNLVLLLALPGWMVYARAVRSLVLSLRRAEFVESARALGASDLRIMIRHLAPSALAPVIVISSSQLAHVIIAEASLSFLGVGVQPPIPSWGSMLSQGREYLSTAWWLGVLPGVAVLITVLGANLLGDGLRDALDPRLSH